MLPKWGFTRHGEEDVQFLTSRNAAASRRSEGAESSRTIGREGEQEDSPGLFDDEVIDLTNYDSDIARPGLPQDGEFPLEAYREYLGAVLCRGDFIQVRNIQLGAHDVEFVKISVIAQDRAGSSKIRGIPFVRTRKLQGKLPKKLNEVCMILHIHRWENGEDPPILVDVSPQSIVKRRTLITTNAVYPEHCYNFGTLSERIPDQERRTRLAELNGELVCRWKFMIYFTLRGRTTRPEEEVFERIQSEDVSEWKYCISEEALCNRWRGGRIKGGSWQAGISNNGVIDLNGRSPPPRSTRIIGQKYTLFDSFSGAGGVSRGAQCAGFKPQYAVDKSPEV